VNDETVTRGARVDGFTWATRVVVPLVAAGLAFYAHQKLTATNQLSTLYTIIKDLKSEDPEEALIYLNLAQKLEQIDAESAQQIKSMLVSKTVESANQSLDSDNPGAESKAIQALDIVQATGSSWTGATQKSFLVIVSSDPTREDAEKVREKVAASGFPGAQVMTTPKQQYVVSLGVFPFSQAIAAKNKFLTMAPIDPEYANSARLRRVRSDWAMVPGAAAPATSGEGPSAGSLSSDQHSSSASQGVHPAGAGARFPHHPAERRPESAYPVR
jgi:hypothetical protein